MNSAAPARCGGLSRERFALNRDIALRKECLQRNAHAIPAFLNLFEGCLLRGNIALQ